MAQKLDDRQIRAMAEIIRLNPNFTGDSEQAYNLAYDCAEEAFLTAPR